MASAAAADDDQSLGSFSGVWYRLRAAASGWRPRGENEGEEAAVRSRLARLRFGRKLAFVSFNLEVLVFVYAFWRARRRNLNWRQPIQALPMLVIPALATLVYAALIRSTRTLDLKDRRMIQRLQEEKQANDCVPREFDQDVQNSDNKYDCTDDPGKFSAAVALAETSKLGTSQQPGINLRDTGGGDMASDHNKDSQPMHSDGLLWRRFSIEETCMTSSNAVIQPYDWLSEHLADDPEHPDDVPRNVGHHSNLGTDVAENTIGYSSAETGAYLLDRNIVHISSNTMDHAECHPPMNNPKYNGGVAEENSVRIALTGPMSDLHVFAELLDEGIQENKSSKFHVSEQSGMPSLSMTELLVGSYAVKNTEHLETSGFSLCSQETVKEDVAGDVCCVRVSPDLTFLSSQELVVEGSMHASKKESCELNTQDENGIVVNSEEETFTASTDEQCSGTPVFFLHAQDSNMMETPALVNIVAVSPEPKYPTPVESLTHAFDDVDFKGDETCNLHLPEQKGQEVLLDPPVVGSYEDSFATSKLLSHSEAAKMTEVPGEDLSESLYKGASNHQNDVAFSSDYGGNTDNIICDLMSVPLITESNVMESLQDGQETLSDPIHHSSSHSAGVFLSSSKVINDEAYSSNSHPYFLYANSMEDEASLAGDGGCSESKGGMNFTFLDTPISLNEGTSAESWTDNAGCSQYFRDSASTVSLQDGNQVQPKKSERANFGLVESFISSEEGIKSEIFSLYSRSSSCVSDVSMIEILSGVTLPEAKNDNNFSFDERNPMMVPNMFHTDSYSNNTRASEFTADINMMKNRNVEVDAFKSLQAERLSEQQCENDFTFRKTKVFPKEVENGGDYLTGTAGDIQYSKETSFDATQYAQPWLSMSQDEVFTPHSTYMSTNGTSDSDLHNMVGSHCFSKDTLHELQPQDPLSFGKALVDPDELYVSENNPDKSKSLLCSLTEGDQRVTPWQQDETTLDFEEIHMGHQGASSENPLNNMRHQCISDSNMVENLEIFQGTESSSLEILHDSSFSVRTSISIDRGNNSENSSYNPESVMHTAEMNTDILLCLQEGVSKPQDEKTVVSVSRYDADTRETNCSNWICAEATMTRAVQDVNKDPSYSQDEYPMTSIFSDKDTNSMNRSNYSISSPPIPNENLIQIPGVVQEGSFELNFEYPSSFEETSISGNCSYNNPMSASCASMNASARSSEKELPGPVLEDVDRFDEIHGDEMSNKTQNKNELSCQQIAIRQAETCYTKVQYCTEAWNIDSTKASESVTEGYFKPEHQGQPELVLSQVGMPFIDKGKETEEHYCSSNAVSSHYEISILETLQELPLAAGMEKGLPEDSNISGWSCIDKEPKDIGINDIEDVENLDEDRDRYDNGDKHDFDAAKVAGLRQGNLCSSTGGSTVSELGDLPYPEHVNDDGNPLNPPLPSFASDTQRMSSEKIERILVECSPAEQP